MTSVTEKLNKAADFIESTGWSQGTFARDEEGRRTDMWGEHAKCFCVSGAIQRIEGRSRWGAWNAFDAYCRKKGYRHMADFNDDPKTTKTDVIKALHRAAKLNSQSEAR